MLHEGRQHLESAFFDDLVEHFVGGLDDDLLLLLLNGFQLPDVVQVYIFVLLDFLDDSLRKLPAEHLHLPVLQHLHVFVIHHLIFVLLARFVSLQILCLGWLLAFFFLLLVAILGLVAVLTLIIISLFMVFVSMVAFVQKVFEVSSNHIYASIGNDSLGLL